ASSQFTSTQYITQRAVAARVAKLYIRGSTDAQVAANITNCHPRARAPFDFAVTTDDTTAQCSRYFLRFQITTNGADHDGLCSCYRQVGTNSLNLYHRNVPENGITANTVTNA